MNTIRNGNFTSSEIVSLLSMGSRAMNDKEKEEYKKLEPKGQKKNIDCWPGKAALTYIEECNMERRHGMAIDSESDARPLSWGKLCEIFAFKDVLGSEYEICNNETIVHPFFNWYCGSPDAKKDDEGGTVVDLKSPMTRKSFSQLVDPLYLEMKEVNGVWQYDGTKVMNMIRNGYTLNDIEYPCHKDGEKYYWQIVSNSILTKSKYGELIVFMPYLSQIQDLQLLANTRDDLQKYYWIINASQPENLPHLMDGGYYKNINTIRFEIPQADKDLLIDRVVAAGKMLIPWPEKISA